MPFAARELRVESMPLPIVFKENCCKSEDYQAGRPAGRIREIETFPAGISAGVYEYTSKRSFYERRPDNDRTMYP